MGRAKLELKYQENSRALRSTYMTRIKGVKKKAGELSLLCGVDVLVASVSPELNTVEFWPEKDTEEFGRIKERYLSVRKKAKGCNSESNSNIHEGNGSSERQIPCPPPMHSPSSSLSLFHEEMIAMEIKLKEVTERLSFLQGSSQRQEEEEPLQRQFIISMPSQEDLLHPLVQQPSSPFTESLHSPFQPSPFPQYLHPHFPDFSMPLEVDIHPHEQPSPFDQPLPPHQQPSPFLQSLPPPEQPPPFVHFLTSDLVDFSTTTEPTMSFMPSNSSLWSHLDDLSPHYEYIF